MPARPHTVRVRHVAAASLAVLTAIASLTACGRDSRGSTDGPLVISASSVPHAQLLREAEKRGLLGNTKIEIKEVTGDVDPNQLLAAGDVDVNFFQHKPYEKAWMTQHGVHNLVDVATVHLEPLGIYSKKVNTLNALPDGATIALPNNVTNFARGLYLLQSAKLIRLKNPDVTKVDVSQVTEKDVVSNPKHLSFVQVDAPQLPRTLTDGKVTAAVINGNYALEANLVPSKDALLLEKVDNNPFANVLTTTTDKQNDPRVKAVAKALTSPQIAQYIGATYQGSVLPVAGQ